MSGIRRLFRAQKKDAPQNALFAIHPYFDQGLWVFDDPGRGLVKEPFVSGMPEMIERATGRLPDPADGFTAVFSARSFPGANIELERMRQESGGWWYRWAATGQEGWLCPALFQYFAEAPPRIFVQVQPRRA